MVNASKGNGDARRRLRQIRAAAATHFLFAVGLLAAGVLTPGLDVITRVIALGLVPVFVTLGVRALRSSADIE
jgi:hypothetical protein